MKSSNYTWFKKVSLITMCAFICLYISGCGADSKNTTSQKEFVYVPEYVKINNEDGGIMNPVVSDDSIYYINSSFNEETQVYTTYFNHLKIGEKEPVKTPLDFDENSNISQLNIDADGNLQAVLFTYIYEDMAEVATPAENAEDVGAEDGDAEDNIPEEGADTSQDNTTEDEEQDDSSEETASDEDAESAVVSGSTSVTAVSVVGADYDYQEPTSQKTEICTISPDGKILSTIDISKNMEDLDNPYVQYMALDNNGNIYLSCDQSILVFNKDGAELCKIDTDKWINSMFSSKDGTVLISAYGEQSLEVHSIDLETKSLKVTDQNMITSPYGNYIFAQGTDTDLLFSVNSMLYSYNFGDQAPTEILNWIDCDINSDELLYFKPLSDGRVLAINSYWENDTNTIEIIYLTKKKGSEVPEKTILTYATMTLDYDMRKQLIEFNKTNQEYRIEVQEFINTSDDYETGRAQFNAAIASGNDMDIIDISYGAMQQYIEMGILEDLYPFIDKDSEIKREDYLENILNTYAVDGKLYAITPTFYINTVAAKVSDVGDRNSITLDELMQIVQDKPDDVDLYEYSSKSNILMMNIMMNMDSYVDWSTGECKFNGEDFIKVLEYANTFPMDFDFNQDRPSTASRLQDNSLMMYDTSLSSVQDYQMMEIIFGEPITLIGYPTNKENGSFISNIGSLPSMSAKSKNKDGVWQFIRMSITKEAQEGKDGRQWGFPIMISALEERFIEDMKEEYYEMPDGTKEKRPKTTMGGNFGDNIEIYAATEEQVAVVRDFIGSVNNIFYYDEDINNIIMEETAAYFEGQKNPKEVADIIQNRVQIYVSENR